MMPVQGYTDCALRPSRAARALFSGCIADTVRLRADPFMGQAATPGVPAVDPYAVKAKN